MQPTINAPRDAFTDDDVIALVRDSPTLVVSAGMDLLDQDLNVLNDLTPYLVAGNVARALYADLHGSGEFQLETELDWGTAIVRPYMNLDDGTNLMRFNLGAYYTSTPSKPIGSDPIVFTVTGVDILDGLNDPVGDTYVLDTGEAYLAAVEDIFLARGFTSYIIDPAQASAVLPSPKVWLLNDQTTFLTIVNDLLQGIGYEAVWSDWDGNLRAERYLSPALRTSEFAYDVGELTSMIEPDRSIDLDFYKVPNRWVFFRTNLTEGATPVEGNGIYTVVNQSTGATSIDARGGRTISKVEGVDAVDQAALINSGTVTVDADQTITSTLNLSTSPNPLHWHADRVTIDDPAVGMTSEALTTQWTLPLDGSAMTHQWTLL